MIWMNHSVVHELLLAAFHLERSDGIYLLKSLSWQLHCLPLDILQIYCDMSGMGMVFWYLSLNLGFQANLPSHPPVNNIFYYEALYVACAIRDRVIC